MIPVLTQILTQAETDWEAVANKETIEPEWWLAFLGRIPENVNQLAPVELLALSVLALQEELHGYKVSAGDYDTSNPGSEPF